MKVLRTELGIFLMLCGFGISCYAQDSGTRVPVVINDVTGQGEGFSSTSACKKATEDFNTNCRNYPVESGQRDLFSCSPSPVGPGVITDNDDLLNPVLCTMGGTCTCYKFIPDSPEPTTASPPELRD